MQACVEVARAGHLPILKWLKENGCPWHNPTILTREADDVVQYVQDELDKMDNK